MGILLTVAVVEALTVGQPAWPTMAGTFAWQFGAAPLLGFTSV